MSRRARQRRDKRAECHLIDDTEIETITDTTDQFQPLRDAQPLFYVRLLEDGLYEGPHHATSVGGRMRREEKPGEWSPLFTAPAALLAEVERLRERERRCETMDHAEKVALLRGLQEIGAKLGIYDPTPADVVAKVERLTAELAAARVDAERLRGIGGQLANVAFNWSQGACAAGQKLTDTERSMLKSLQRQWDDAARTA